MQGAWRWGWDSNPRGGCPPTRFPGAPDRPLPHPTVKQICTPGLRRRLSRVVRGS